MECTSTQAQRTAKSLSNFEDVVSQGMNERIRQLRKESYETQPTLSIERALIETEFYKKNEGKYSIPVMRAMNYLELCKRKTIYIGENELIVGERGPKPKAVPTFPELNCHSVEDLQVLNTRELQRYTISDADIEKIGRASCRERVYVLV